MMGRGSSRVVSLSILVSVSALAGALSLSACGGGAPPPPAEIVAAKVAPPPPLTCAAGTGDCDNDRGNACEAALDSSSSNCGACGNTCGAGEACMTGSCRRTTIFSAADDHACLLLPSGEARCWGDNSEGDLGDGTKEMRTTPVPVKDLSDAISIRASEDLACAIQKNGKLFCWGQGKSTTVPFLEGVVDVAIRRRMFCAALRTGEVRCAEPNLGGDGSLDAEPSPEISDAVAVAGGAEHACALRKTGEVVCWGDEDLTGSGIKKDDRKRADDEDRDASEKRAVVVKGLSDAVQIASLRTHTCAVRKTGKIACWGRNWSGQLGDGTSDDHDGLVEVQFISDAVEVAVGGYHTCALRKTGEVACWGDGAQGELGGGKRESSRGPVPVKGISDAVHISAGERFSCAMRKSGAVSCWGSAQRGRLGNGTKAEISEPLAVPGIENATAVTVGANFSCALLKAGGVSCWGRGSYASYGDGMRERGVPAMVVQGIDDATALRAGDRNVCAIKKSGDAACWRGGVPNYLDNAKENAPYNPFVIKGIPPVKAMIDTTNTSLALLRSGQALLWGLERGSYSNKDPGPATTITIAGLSDAVEIAGNDDFGCAVRRSGKVACLRYSAYRTFDKKKPVKPTGLTEVPDLKDVVKIAYHGGEFYVLRKTGEVAYFSSYALPRPEEKPEPGKKREPIVVRPVEGLKDVTAVAVGGSFRCVLHASGQVSCWGSNGRGELGRGDFESHYEPGFVKGLSDAADIAASSSHACALRKSGGVVCWGTNEEDQVGHKDPSSAPLPVEVAGLGK